METIEPAVHTEIDLRNISFSAEMALLKKNKANIIDLADYNFKIIRYPANPDNKLDQDKYFCVPIIETNDGGLDVDNPNFLGIGTFGYVTKVYPLDESNGKILFNKPLAAKIYPNPEVFDKQEAEIFRKKGYSVLPLKIKIPASDDTENKLSNKSTDYIDKETYVFMDLLGDVELEDFLENQFPYLKLTDLSFIARVKILREIAFAFNVMHHHKPSTGNAVFHADIKPQNIRIGFRCHFSFANIMPAEKDRVPDSYLLIKSDNHTDWQLVYIDAQKNISKISVDQVASLTDLLAQITDINSFEKMDLGLKNDVQSALVGYRVKVQKKDAITDIHIIDFGLSTKLKDNQDPHTILEFNDFRGTHLYAAPEMFKDSPKGNITADLYALTPVVIKLLSQTSNEVLFNEKIKHIPYDNPPEHLLRKLGKEKYNYQDLLTQIPLADAILNEKNIELKKIIINFLDRMQNRDISKRPDTLEFSHFWNTLCLFLDAYEPHENKIPPEKEISVYNAKLFLLANNLWREKIGKRQIEQFEAINKSRNGLKKSEKISDTYHTQVLTFEQYDFDAHPEFCKMLCSPFYRENSFHDIDIYLFKQMTENESLCLTVNLLCKHSPHVLTRLINLLKDNTPDNQNPGEIACLYLLQKAGHQAVHNYLNQFSINQTIDLYENLSQQKIEISHFLSGKNDDFNELENTFFSSLSESIIDLFKSNKLLSLETTRLYNKSIDQNFSLLLDSLKNKQNFLKHYKALNKKSDYSVQKFFLTVMPQEITDTYLKKISLQEKLDLLDFINKNSVVKSDTQKIATQIKANLAEPIDTYKQEKLPLKKDKINFFERHFLRKTSRKEMETALGLLDNAVESKAGQEKLLADENKKFRKILKNSSLKKTAKPIIEHCRNLKLK